ncbi:MAG: hypothetical protein IPP14_14505 [Planctomycetes bacterium]|nr:hypothetical protein [Planctomycetota bacterium]
MKNLLALVCLLALPLSAHPLDDKAEVRSDVTLASGNSIEVSVEFRYSDVRASYTEFAAGLDRNQDGAVTRDELRLRFLDLVDPLSLALTVQVDGKPLALAPEFARFEFSDLNNAKASVDDEGGLPTYTSRIFYRFVFTGVPEPVPAAGLHRVEFTFNTTQNVLHTPQQQMVPHDARPGAAPVQGAKWDHAQGGLARLSFDWPIADPNQPASNEPRNEPGNTPGNAPASNTPASNTPAANTRPEAGPDGAEIAQRLPAILTLISGALMALIGLGTAASRLRDRKNRWARTRGPLLVAFCGAAITLGAMLRLGLIGTL